MYREVLLYRPNSQAESKSSSEFYDKSEGKGHGRKGDDNDDDNNLYKK